MLIPKRRAAKLIICGGLLYACFIVFGTFQYFMASDSDQLSSERYKEEKTKFTEKGRTHHDKPHSGIKHHTQTTRKPFLLTKSVKTANTTIFKSHGNEPVAVLSECTDIKHMVELPPALHSDLWKAILSGSYYGYSAFVKSKKSITVIGIGKSTGRGARGFCQLWSQKGHYVQLNITAATMDVIPETHGFR